MVVSIISPAACSNITMVLFGAFVTGYSIPGNSINLVDFRKSN